jgi:ERCC4-related helicase
VNNLQKEPKIIDNKTQGFVYEELKDSIKKGSKLSVISAYFSIYAYDELKKELDKIDNMRFIYTKPSFIKSNKEKESREYYIDNNSIFGNDFEIKLKNQLTQSSISKECAKWIKDRTDIKSLKIPNEAQPRMIVVDNGDDSNISINGTVDFTSAGLGFSPSNRQDLNMCNYGQLVTQNSLLLFENLWNNDQLLEDVKDEVLKQMETMYKENSPDFIYFLSLYNIFSGNLDSLDEDNIIRKGNQLKSTKIWNKLYTFQKDAVIGAIDKIEKYNGCIVADSVGLGKTYTALAVIKYYELRNDRVLVLAPKKLRDNWTIYTQNDKRNIFVDDRFNYDVLNHTDLSRESGKSGDLDLKTINWGNYDLVVIDESHNFRNNPAVKDRKTRYQKLMQDIIKGGHKTRLLMLSATPVNNKMTDIKNQIAFITEDNDRALEEEGIPSIENTLRKAQGVFNRWAKVPDELKNESEFIDKIDLDYFKLLDTLTIARSRRHIEKYYGLDEIGEFPERKKPKNIKSEIADKEIFPPLNEINSEISRLNLGIYRPMDYIYPNKLASYEQKYDVNLSQGSKFKQRDRDQSVTQLMRINLLKRMESSIEAFRLTTQKLLDNINETLKRLDNNVDEIPSDIDINLIDPEEEEYDDMMFGRNRKILIQDIDPVKWRQDLELDRAKLEDLLIKANNVSPEEDCKLQDLKELIKTKVNNPINPNNKKIIVFTSFADTAKYLYENLHQWILDDLGLHSALVTGSSVNKTTLKTVTASDINDVLINFSPISKERESIDPDASEEIDILICTDCISEGQNLQDCDYLINYDIHWNPVRIIQRFGRIDRIGSKNKQVQLVNFWPNMELDEYINLEGRVKNKMQMVDISATGEENLISDDQSMNDLQYRKNQLKELQDKVLDIEDISNTISITDLTFNDFKIELMNYMKEHKVELERAPKGIYSITNIPQDLRGEISPGVIFLLRQTSGTAESIENNPLSPYYLVYIGENGELRFNYIKSKKILDYYKKLCVDNDKVLTNLVRIFDDETNDGKDMEKYSTLLAEAIENILGKKQEVGVSSLFHSGGTNTVRQDMDALEEFELISFLIIKDE